MEGLGDTVDYAEAGTLPKLGADKCDGHSAGKEGSDSQNGITRWTRPSPASSTNVCPLARRILCGSTIALPNRAALRKVFKPVASTKRQPGQFVWKPVIFSDIAL